MPRDPRRTQPFGLMTFLSVRLSDKICLKLSEWMILCLKRCKPPQSLVVLIRTTTTMLSMTSLSQNCRPSSAESTANYLDDNCLRA